MYVVATGSKTMYPMIGGYIQPVWGSQGWLHRRGDIFKGNEEVVKSCGVKDRNRTGRQKYR